MVRRDIEKTSALLLALFIIATAIAFRPYDWSSVGIAAGCGLSQRLSYHFFHASVLHAAVNAWCLLSVVFLYLPSWRQLLIAYAIAVAVPGWCLSATPTVGLSAICFALLGSCALCVRRRLFYNAVMAAYIALGFLFPLVNGWIHLYSYVAGLLVGLLNMPLRCKK